MRATSVLFLPLPRAAKPKELDAGCQSQPAAQPGMASGRGGGRRHGRHRCYAGAMRIELAEEADLPAILAISNWAAEHTIANFATEPEPLEEWRQAFLRTHAD